MLKDKDLEHFRERLAAERVAVESRIAARSRDVQATVRDEEGVGDRGDEATLLYDREQAIDDTDLDRDMSQIDRALQRIEEGTYGVSEVSGQADPDRPSGSRALRDDARGRGAAPTTVSDSSASGLARAWVGG